MDPIQSKLQMIKKDFLNVGVWHCMRWDRADNNAKLNIMSKLGLASEPGNNTSPQKPKSQLNTDK